MEETSQAVFNCKKRAFIEYKQKEDDEYYYIEGYASTFGNVDRHNDIVVKGAFEKTLRTRKPKLLWQHNMDEPIGVVDTIYEDERGLYMVAKMPKANTDVSNIFSLVKAGAVSDFSIGFNAVQTEVNEDTGIRMIKEVDLWEVSLVTIPANPAARLTSFKSATPFKDYGIAPRDKEWDSRAAVQRVRAYSGSDESPSSTYKNFFLWYDADATESFGSYKLPFVDIINGEPQVVVNAVVAAKAAIAGARGGVDIPDGDKDRIMANIDKYLEKAGVGEKDSDLSLSEKRIFTIEDVEEIKTKREFEQMLRESGVFTKKASKLIASNSNFVDSPVWDAQEATQGSSEQIKSIMKELDDLKKAIKG